MLEATSQHEKELQEYIGEIEKLSEKNQLYEKVKAELEYSESIIADNKESLRQVQKMENSLHQYRAELMNKDNVINILK